MGRRRARPGRRGRTPGRVGFGHSKSATPTRTATTRRTRLRRFFSRRRGFSVFLVSFPELAAGEPKGRAAVARLQATLARPGAAASSSAESLVGGVIQRGGFGAGGAPWSPDAIARLVGLLPDALVFEPGLREQWADEARRVLRAASFPLAAASARVLAALRVPLDQESCDALLAATCSAAAAAEGGALRGLGDSDGFSRAGSSGFGSRAARSSSGSSSRSKHRHRGDVGSDGRVVSARSAQAAADLACLLLDTLAEMMSLVEDERDLVRYPHVAWGAAACLRTLHPPLYARAARLFSTMALAWPLDDPTGAAERILEVAAPQPVGARYPRAGPGATARPARPRPVHRAAGVVRGDAAARPAATPAAAPSSSRRRSRRRSTRGCAVRFGSLPRRRPSATRRRSRRRCASPTSRALLVRACAARESATHAARALAAVAPVVGVGRRWGGRRALALVVAGLLPVVAHAAAAAEEGAARAEADPAGRARAGKRSPRGGFDASDAGDGIPSPNGAASSPRGGSGSRADDQ